MHKPPARQVPRPSAKEAINSALELFNRRWTLRILWELRGAPMNFRQLQAACGDLSASVLSQRLAQLREALLLEHDPGSGYRLSRHGQDLLLAFQPLLDWSRPWAGALAKARQEAGNG